MKSGSREVVTLGAQIGGPDAFEKTNKHIIMLRGILKNECVGPYSSVIREFAIVIRIDGSIEAWGEEGVGNLRVQKKFEYVTADIFVTERLWVDEKVFRGYLISSVRLALEKMAERLRGQGIDLADRELMADIDRVARQYLEEGGDLPQYLPSSP